MTFSSAQVISMVRTWLLEREMSCEAVQRWLPGYLDDALPEGRGGSKLHARMAQHLGKCASCRAELKGYQAISRAVLGAQAAEPPDELAISIRLAVARAREAGTLQAFVEHCKHRLDLLLDHVIEPLLLPVTGGALVALIVFGVVFPMLGGALSLPATHPDPPTNLMQPARLLTLAGFPLPGLDDVEDTEDFPGLFVEATVNAQGQAVAYRVIGDPPDAGTQRQLDRVVLFSRFRPQMSFGRPTSGGRVVLGFSRVVVRG